MAVIWSNVETAVLNFKWTQFSNYVRGGVFLYLPEILPRITWEEKSGFPDMLAVARGTSLLPVSHPLAVSETKRKKIN